MVPPARIRRNAFATSSGRRRRPPSLGPSLIAGEQQGDSVAIRIGEEQA
jgi:hypothetical protein